MTKKRIIIVTSVMVVIFLGCLLAFNSVRISESDIKQIVLEKTYEGEKYMKLIEEDGKSDIYESVISFPHKVKLNSFIKLKYVERIAAFPDEYIIIYFKHPPKGYTGWGIYYQKDNKMKGYSGLELYEDCIIDENTYRFDGRKRNNKQKIVYETERICDNWFFFKEEFWN